MKLKSSAQDYAGRSQGAGRATSEKPDIEVGVWAWG